MKRLFAVLLTLCMLCASALADSLTTNGGVTLDTADLPYCTADESAPVVYFISDISPESLVAAYQALGVELPGKVGVKMSTGESERSNYLRPELIADLIHRVNGTIVECNTAYPNWWASIPMPIATFLESYDFSGKTILPFCSHGGGRFGQSLTAIAKLAPQAVIAPGLSVHYSGGSGLPNDVQAWLESQGIPTNQ